MRCNFLLISLFALFATACEHANTDGKEFEVSGAVQKGPFIVGTPVFVNRLDNKGVASENTVISEIEDSIGTFSFRVSEEGPVQIVANGYFFNELTGQISSGTLVLKAIYNASAENDQKAYVNILTHLINDRVLKLIETGDIQLSDAIETAQLELIGELNPVLPIENISNFNGLSVYNDNAKSELENAYLLALSTAFYKYAELKALNQDTSADAQLSLILNVVSDDFAEDGIIQTPNFINDLTNSLRMLNPVQIAENLKSRSLIDYSEPASVPDISRFFGLCAGDLECDWSSRAPMPVPTRGHASAVYQGSILVFGGTSPNDYDEL